MNEAENTWAYSWLLCKPYVRKPGNNEFYDELYQVMNLLRAMEIPYGGKVLEVGSGPGWVTEILVALGCEVHALEPSGEMIDIARARMVRAIEHWQLQNPPPFEFFCQTLEECNLPENENENEYDGVFFHAALHYIIGEKVGLSQCYRLLKLGGVLGASEAAWEPGTEIRGRLRRGNGAIRNP